MAQIEIKNLTFTYPLEENKCLNNICMEIYEGEFIALCGASGSGKSTLLKHLKTALTPAGAVGGAIYYLDEELSRVSLRTQSTELGFVMQNPDNQIVTDKVWHELAFGLENLCTDDQTIQRSVAEMASYFGITDWFDKNVNTLSGGQKQLLNLAAVMVMHPKVLILDEPTSQLDPIAAENFLLTLKKINRELGITIIITEHRLEEIFTFADRIVIIDKGELVFDDIPQKVGGAAKDVSAVQYLSLPTAVRIYTEFDNPYECPLTVRDGRRWIRQMIGNHPAAVQLQNEQAVKGENYAVELEHTFLKYDKNGNDILKNCSVKIPSGVIYSVLGGNGAGKSTMLKMIANVIHPYKGKVSVKGKRIEKYKSGELYQGNIGYLPQDVQTMFVHSTVKGELLDMLSGTDDKTELINDIAKQTEILTLLNKHPYDLSGGEQQRVALAKLLMLDPEILLLDEPTKGMDSLFKGVFAALLKSFSQSGKTVIIVSHDIEFCAKHSDICAMFFDGNIVSSGAPREFFSRNNFYTTAASRMTRNIFENAVTDKDVIELCRKNLS